MKFFKIILTVLGVCLFVVISWFIFTFRAPLRKTENERFIVKQNAKEEQVIDDLFSNGFIRNKKVFKFSLDLLCWQRKTCIKTFDSAQGEVGQRIQSGAYMISKSMNAYQLSGTLIYGPFQKWVIIPTGKRKEQTAIIVKKALDWPYSTARHFIDVATEGYLYPDTYLIDVKASPEEVIQKLQNNFNEKFDAQLQKDLLSQNIRTDTALKIASLIERESGGAEDKPIIAGIIWNRLLEGMRLEIDATVQYAITSEKLDDVGLQGMEDISFWPLLGGGVVRKIDSPYNTYLIKALPPGPISSPSIESIKAVAYPSSTDAFYYLHSSDKQIHTAKTYKEHQENIVKYLK